MSFNDIFSNLVTGSLGSFGFVDVFLSLVVPAVLCIGVVAVYKRTQTHASFSPSFLLMLFMFASLSGGVTLFIGENIARAFGLVGAMSIIRFRNALKEPIDAVFVLWTLTIGMVCGAGYYLAAAFLTVTVAGVTLAVKKLGLAEFETAKTVIKVVTNADADERIRAEVEKKLNGYTKAYKMLHEMSEASGDKRTRVYTLTPKKNINVSRIESEISEVEGANVYGSIYRPSVNVME